MKKLFILIMLLITSFTTVKLYDVEGFIETGYFLTYDSPKFMYLYDDNGTLNDLAFTVGEQVNYYNEPLPKTFVLEQVNYDGTLVKQLREFNIDLEHNITFEGIGTVQTTVTTLTEPVYIDLKSVLGEIGFIVSVDNQTTATTLSSSEYYYDEDDKIIVADPVVLAINDVISVTFQFKQGTLWSKDILYDWSDLYIPRDRQPVFWRLLHGSKVIGNGAIYPNQNYLTIDDDGVNESVELGGYFDGNNATQLPPLEIGNNMTYEKRSSNYFIIHYHLNDTVIYSDQDRNPYIVFTDIDTNLTEFAFTTSDILFYQNIDFNYLDGVPDNTRNAFIIIGLDGDIPPAFYYNQSNYFNDRAITHDFDIGSYVLTVNHQDTNALLNNSHAVINVTETNEDIFDLDLLYDDLIVTNKQRVSFTYNDDIIKDNFTTTTAKDLLNDIDYSNNINNLGESITIGYRVSELAEHGDNIGVIWELEPVSLPFNLTPSDFKIRLSNNYDVTVDISTTARINNLLTYYGVIEDGDILIISISVILILNMIVVLLLKQKALLPSLLVNVVLIITFTTLGFIPIWLSIGLGVLIIMGIMIVVNKDGSGSGDFVE